MDTPLRKSSMAERIGSTPVARLDPAPVFFANLGDFAGPGTPDRHRHYLRLAEALPVPNICVVGNHDLDDAGGKDAWAGVHGPMNFDFAHGHTHFLAINDAWWRSPSARTGQ
jgi:hypothetical protein